MKFKFFKKIREKIIDHSLGVIVAGLFAFVISAILYSYDATKIMILTPNEEEVLKIARSYMGNVKLESKYYFSEDELHILSRPVTAGGGVRYLLSKNNNVIELPVYREQPSDHPMYTDEEFLEVVEEGMGDVRELFTNDFMQLSEFDFVDIDKDEKTEFYYFLGDGGNGGHKYSLKVFSHERIEVFSADVTLEYSNGYVDFSFNGKMKDDPKYVDWAIGLYSDKKGVDYSSSNEGISGWLKLNSRKEGWAVIPTTLDEIPLNSTCESEGYIWGAGYSWARGTTTITLTIKNIEAKESNVLYIFEIGSEVFYEGYVFIGEGEITYAVITGYQDYWGFTPSEIKEYKIGVDSGSFYLIHEERHSIGEGAGSILQSKRAGKYDYLELIRKNVNNYHTACKMTSDSNISGIAVTFHEKKVIE